MMYATKIKMNHGCYNSSRCIDINSIYLEGCSEDGFYLKGILHDYLISNPNSIRVKKGSEPYLIPAKSVSSEKYVRSEPNDTIHDNLLCLPRV